VTVPFKQISQAIRVPLFYAEVDNSQANTATAVQRSLIIGQITGTGTGTPNVPQISQGVGDAAAVGGVGSMIHLMTQAYRAADTLGELWYLPLTDDGAAVAAAGSVNFTHVATANGVLSFYIGGVRVQMAVVTTQTANQLATAFAAAINATANLPVTAAVDGVTLSKVNITARNAGAAGNDIDLRFNYGGAPAGEATPAGLTYALVAMAAGATNPTLTTGLANLANKSFDFIVCPYTDSTSLGALKSFLDDVTGRWSWQQQLYGHVFIAYRGTFGALTTFGQTQNNQHQSVLGFYDSPTPNWIAAADFAASSAVSLRNDPALPLQTVALSTMLPPPLASQFSMPQQNQLLYNGISTFNVLNDGTVTMQNIITSYLTNAYSQPDNSYLEIETMFTLAFVIRFLAGRVTSKFGRKKLAANGTRTANPNVVTPNIIRADQIAAFLELEELGLVQDSAGFAANLIVEQNKLNPNRVDVLWPGALVDQLRIFALLAQFRLQAQAA
jgi:phage tail sheath gpL-like